jgi:hypothetical protein
MLRKTNGQREYSGVLDLTVPSESCSDAPITDALAMETGRFYAQWARWSIRRSCDFERFLDQPKPKRNINV